VVHYTVFQTWKILGFFVEQAPESEVNPVFKAVMLLLRRLAAYRTISVAAGKRPTGTSKVELATAYTAFETRAYIGLLPIIRACNSKPDCANCFFFVILNTSALTSHVRHAGDAICHKFAPGATLYHSM